MQLDRVSFRLGDNFPPNFFLIPGGVQKTCRYGTAGHGLVGGDG